MAFALEATTAVGSVESVPFGVIVIALPDALKIVMRYPPATPTTACAVVGGCGCVELIGGRLIVSAPLAFDTSSCGGVVKPGPMPRLTVVVAAATIRELLNAI